MLLLSCFGHVRAKTYSELPYRLELCLTFRLGLSSVILLLHRAVKGLFGCWYVVVEPWTVLAWLVCGKPVNPAVLVWLLCVPLAMCKPAIDP